jgi:predicted MFS family arabinose efflux permease
MAMTAQQNAITLITPPFLHELKYPVSVIGWLISVAPVFTLAARLPSGLVYRGHWARVLMVASLLAMAVASALYSLAVRPVHFALVHALNGFLNGAATTFYFAFFMDALPAGENRHHAMGYYAGALSLGYSFGGLVAGYVADRLGYAAAFWFSALVALFSLTLFLFLGRPAPAKKEDRPSGSDGTHTIFQSLRSLAHPGIAAIVIVALFLNMLHQIGSTFFPLYGLAVGLTLTQVGLIRGSYALCNAVIRPLSGLVVSRLGHRSLSRVGLPLQAGFFMLFPLFQDVGSLLVVSVLAGSIRAVVLVANTIGMVEDMDETRFSRGVASGIFNAAGDLGLILGPGFGGFVASFTGIPRLFFVGPLLVALAFLLSLWGSRFVRPVPLNWRESR